MRVGIGVDAHRFAPGRLLVLGGVEIAHERGLDGHSDADVVCHAIADALLGAAGLGDLGALFPSGDPRWKDVASTDLLAIVAAALAEHGYEIANVDAVAIAQAPSLARHRDAMRRAVAGALGIDESQVSVKATTTDGMGFTGRGEGIAATAVALVRPKSS